MKTNDKKRITIRDVAKVAGVSIATVSRVINGRNDKVFPTETRKHVWNIAHQMGYEPNQQARKLRSGITSPRTKTNLIMRIFNQGSEEIIGKRELADNMQIFDWAVNKHGLFLTNYHYYHEKGFRCPLLLDDLIDGVVIGTSHEEVIRSVAEKVPTVLLDVEITNGRLRFPSVNSATEDGVEKLFSRAKELGHNAVAIVGGPVKEDGVARNYFRIIRNTAEKLGFRCSAEFMYQPPDINENNHDEIMHEIACSILPAIRSGKISLIAGEDIVYARSLYNGLISLGVKIPEEVSIISVDSINVQEKENTTPITSAAHDWIQLSNAAVEMLVALIEGKESNSEILVAPLMKWGATLDKPKKHNKKEKLK